MRSDDAKPGSRATQTDTLDLTSLKVLASSVLPEKSLRSSRNDVKTMEKSSPQPPGQRSKCQTPTHHHHCSSSRSSSPNLHQPNPPTATFPPRDPSPEETIPFHVPHQLSSTTTAARRPLPPPPRSKETILIQVAPGVCCPLMGGSDETWQSILHDTFVSSWCEGCHITVFCVPHVTLVLCPQCRSVFPIAIDDDNDHDNTTTHEDDMVNGGVGLGFVFDDLIRWGPEIEHERRQQRRR